MGRGRGGKERGGRGARHRQTGRKNVCIASHKPTSAWLWPCRVLLGSDPEAFS